MAAALKMMLLLVVSSYVVATAVARLSVSLPSAVTTSLRNRKLHHVCNFTMYPKLCYKTVKPEIHGRITPAKVLRVNNRVAIAAASDLDKEIENLIAKARAAKDNSVMSTLVTCKLSYEKALSDLKQAATAFPRKVAKRNLPKFSKLLQEASSALRPCYLALEKVPANKLKLGVYTQDFINITTNSATMAVHLATKKNPLSLIRA